MNSKVSSIFRNRNFVLLWLGQLVSGIGTSMHAIAVMWYVLEKTGSPKEAGITLIFTTVPKLLISPLAGPIADRINRKRIIVITDMVNGLLVGIIAVLAFTNQLDLWMLYALSACMSATSAFFSPAVSASLPTIVTKEHLVRANAISQMTRYGTGILGPTVGGVLIAVIGIPGLFLMNGISFILSGVSESFMTIPHTSPNPIDKKPLLREFAEGVHYTITNKSLLHIMIVGGIIINYFYAPLSLFVAVFVRESLGGTSDGYGMLLSALSVGGLTMSYIITKVSHRFGKYKLLFIGLVLEGVLLIPLSFVNTLAIAILVAFSLGCAFGIVNVIFGTVVQELVPDNLRGRVYCVLNILCTITVPLGYYLGGLAVEVIAPTTLYLIIGICVTLAGLSTYGLTKLDAVEDEAMYSVTS